MYRNKKKCLLARARPAILSSSEGPRTTRRYWDCCSPLLHPAAVAGVRSDRGVPRQELVIDYRPASAFLSLFSPLRILLSLGAASLFLDIGVHPRRRVACLRLYGASRYNSQTCLSEGGSLYRVADALGRCLCPLTNRLVSLHSLMRRRQSDVDAKGHLDRLDRVSPSSAALVRSNAPERRIGIGVNCVTASRLSCAFKILQSLYQRV